MTSLSGRWSSASASAERSPAERVRLGPGQLPVLDLLGVGLQRLALLLAVGVDVGVGEDAVQPRLEVRARAGTGGRRRTPWRRSPGRGPRRPPGCASSAARPSTAGRGTASPRARSAPAARLGGLGADVDGGARPWGRGGGGLLSLGHRTPQPSAAAGPATSRAELELGLAGHRGQVSSEHATLLRRFGSRGSTPSLRTASPVSARSTALPAQPVRRSVASQPRTSSTTSAGSLVNECVPRADLTTARPPRGADLLRSAEGVALPLDDGQRQTCIEAAAARPRARCRAGPAGAGERTAPARRWRRPRPRCGRPPGRRRCARPPRAGPGGARGRWQPVQDRAARPRPSCAGGVATAAGHPPRLLHQGDHPAVAVTAVSASRSGAPTPPPAPCPSTSCRPAVRAPAEVTRAVPTGSGRTLDRRMPSPPRVRGVRPSSGIVQPPCASSGRCCAR